jgi:hypothetical protein
MAETMTDLSEMAMEAITLLRECEQELFKHDNSYHHTTSEQLKTKLAAFAEKHGKATNLRPNERTTKMTDSIPASFWSYCRRCCILIEYSDEYVSRDSNWHYCSKECLAWHEQPTTQYYVERYIEPQPDQPAAPKAAESVQEPETVADVYARIERDLDSLWSTLNRNMVAHTGRCKAGDGLQSDMSEVSRTWGKLSALVSIVRIHAAVCIKPAGVEEYAKHDNASS